MAILEVKPPLDHLLFSLRCQSFYTLPEGKGPFLRVDPADRPSRDSLCQLRSWRQVKSRTAQRLPTRLVVRVFCNGAESWGRMVDLSVRSARVQLNVDCPIGARIGILAPDGDPLSAPGLIEGVVTARRRQQVVIGFFPGMQSSRLLRRIVRSCYENGTVPTTWLC
jgi:hypothetical protein